MEVISDQNVSNELTQRTGSSKSYIHTNPCQPGIEATYVTGNVSVPYLSKLLSSVFPQVHKPNDFWFCFLQMTILGLNKTFLGVFHILSTSPIVASTLGQKLLKFCTHCCNVILSFAW